MRDGSEPTDRGAARGAAAMLRFIETNLRDGTWKPGDRLPTERDLGARFGVARNTLRKRLKALELEGKIVRRLGSGSFVADTIGHDRGPCDEDDLVARILGASPAEIMEFRQAVEPHAVDLAVARATSADIAGMEACLLRADRAASVAQFEIEDAAFHAGIVAAARSPLLESVYGAVNGARRLAQWGTLKERTLTPERRVLFQQQHRAILAALKLRDVEAAREALRTHLLSVWASLYP